MSDAVFTPAIRPAALPLREVLPWLVFAGLLCLIAICFVGAE